MTDVNSTSTTEDAPLPNTDHNYARGTIPTMPEKSIDQNNVIVGNNGANWQTVSKRRSFDPLTRGQKKLRQENSPSCSIELQNSFDVLSSVNEPSMDADITSTKLSEPKPPPIFIPDVGNVQAMIRTFESIVSTDEFSYKCVNNNSVKILPKSADTYRRLVRKLNEGNVSFHTYQLKQERAYRVVLKNMHYSVDTAELKAALGQLGHTVRNITNVIQSSTKKPLSMFFIDLEPSSNNKDIFNVQYLLHAKITFEPPYKKKEIVQCKRCQQYGHTKSYCRHPFKCVKCGQDHDTSKCQKDNTTPAVCVLCGGDHPANYKGCSVYKNIQNRTYPQLRKRPESVKDAPATRSISPTQPPPPSYRPVRPNLSYAGAVNNVKVSSNNTTAPCGMATHNRNHETLSEHVHNLNENLNQSGSLSDMIEKSFARFESILTKQAEQISSLLNLLTTIVSRIK
jgi:hypothetical protein